MVEGRRFVVEMAFVAFIRGVVALHAIFMGILLDTFGRGFRVMAAAAILFAVAIGASAPELIHMVFVMEGDHGAFLKIWGGEDAFVGNRGVRMQAARDIRGIRGRDRFAGHPFGMAYHTVRGMAPFPVAGHALAMVSAFEAGFPKVFLFWGDIMTGAACRDFSAFVMMMTDSASIGHGFHLGVQSVGKYHGNVEFGKLTDSDDIGRRDILGIAGIGHAGAHAAMDRDQVVVAGCIA